MMGGKQAIAGGRGRPCRRGERERAKGEEDWRGRARMKRVDHGTRE